MVKLGDRVVGVVAVGESSALTLAFFASTKTMTCFTRSSTKVINDGNKWA